ncbi:MAG: HAD family phosphatase [Chloroflexi bacterium]|nr:HAD family phosphatase [Chloroflexota bacterium]
MIQAILLDAGGVLVTEGQSRKRLAEFDHLLGWEPGTMHRRLYSGSWWEAVSTGRVSVAAYWQAVGQAWEEHLPADFKLFIDNFYAHQLDLATLHLAWRLRPYYRLGLLSNATVQLPRFLLSEKRLRSLFDVTIISALEGVRKPDAAMYELPLQRLGIAAAACVLVDDRERNTAAAEALGMKTIVHTDALATEQALRRLGVRLASHAVLAQIVA